MLVLSRGSGEKILINPGTPDEIVITVIEVERGRARIGIDAPLSMVIQREENLLKDQARREFLGED